MADLKKIRSLEEAHKLAFTAANFNKLIIRANVEFLPLWNTAAVKKVLGKQDAIYVSFKYLEIFNTGKSQ